MCYSVQFVLQVGSIGHVDFRLNAKNAFIVYRLSLSEVIF